MNEQINFAEIFRNVPIIWGVICVLRMKERGWEQGTDGDTDSPFPLCYCYCNPWRAEPASSQTLVQPLPPV